MIELLLAVPISAGVSWGMCFLYWRRELDPPVKKLAEKHHLAMQNKSLAVYKDAKKLNVKTDRLTRINDEELVKIRQLTEKNEALLHRCEELEKHAENILYTSIHGR